MTQGFEQIGVQAIFDATGFVRGFQQYVASIGDANRAGEQFANRLQQAGNTSLKAFQDFSKGTKRALNDTDRALKNTQKTTRSFVDNLFNIQVAFNALTNTAQSAGDALYQAASRKDIERSFRNLATSAGVNADLLQSSMEDAAKGIVNSYELMRLANRAFLAGGRDFAEAMPQLFEIARVTAAQSGKDVLYILESLVTGVARASYRLIDNADIFLRVGPVIEAYADSLGIAVEEIDEAERRLIILNEVTKQGQDIIKNLGGDVELATDKFNKFKTEVTESKQAFQSFLLEAFGTETSAKIYAVTELLGGISSQLLTITLLAKGLKAIGIGGILAGLGAGAAGVAGAILTPVGLGVGGGILAYDQLVAPTLGLDRLGTTVGKLSDILQYNARKLKDGKEAADEWFRAVNGMETIADRAMKAIELLNAELADQETATERAGLDLAQQVVDFLPPIPFVKERMQQIVDETSAGVDEIEEEFRQAEIAEALAEAMARVNDELRDDIQDVLDNISEQLSERQEARIDFYTDSAALEREHQDTLTEITQDGADKRQDIEQNYARAVRDAQAQYQQAVEDANRQHTYRLEDIERTYQRRIQEIQRNYRMTVEEAAAERDALAIYRAGLARDEQLRDAEETRSDQLRAEEQNYQDRLRAAQQALEEQTQAAREQYQDRIRDLDRSIAEEETKEQNSYARRLADLRKYYNDVIAETSAFIARYQEQLNRLRGQGYKIPGFTGGPDSIAVPMQHGFDGVVTGPKMFYVEPGVREYIHASGDLSGRESVAPSNTGMQAQMMRATVSGAVGASLSGFNQGLLDRIGPSLTDMIVQGTLDEIGEALLRNL